jgi:D-alanine-D-alanine ligase
MDNQKITIVFGSQSFEHEISIVSAIAMKKVLNNKLAYIFIDKDREFYDIPAEVIKSNLFSSGEYKKYSRLEIAKQSFLKKTIFGVKKIDPGIVLNLVHGGDGEDGVLAGLFQFFEIPFIGPRVEASVMSCNKYLTKQYAQACDVKTIDFKYYTKNDDIEVDDYPVIIKPVRLGSSIGISIVKDQKELEYALDVAFEFDDAIIIEPFCEGISEFNLAGTKINGEFVFSIIEEPHKEEYLDFDKKYLDFNRTSKVQSAAIDESLQEKLKEKFVNIYNNYFEGAIIRCDFFVLEGEVYINEINPIPGSMANYLFEDFNIIFNQLALNLPKRRKIVISYEYVNKIQSAKGKV